MEVFLRKPKNQEYDIHIHLTNILHFEKGLWQQANIGQYSSQIRTLFRFPWIRKKAETLYLSVYQLRENGN